MTKRLRGLIRRIREWVYMQEEVCLFVLLAPPVSAPRKPFGFHVSTQRSEWAPALALKKENGMELADEDTRRATHQDSCYSVMDGPRCVHYTWQTTRERINSEIGYRITPAEGEAWLYDSFTAPSHRGQGLYTTVLQNAAFDFLTSGGNAVWCEALKHNIPSQRGILKAGFILAGKIRKVRWFIIFSWARRIEGEHPEAAKAFRRQVLLWD